jgi:hypothetical protein
MSFLLLQQRNKSKTTNINHDRVSDVSTERSSHDIDDLLLKLSENAKKGKSGNFADIIEVLNKLVSVSKTPLTENQSQQLISSLKEWTKKDHSDQQCANVLKFIANMQISSFSAEQKEIIIAIVDQFLKNKQQSLRWFALFLSAIRELTLSGILLKTRHKQRIVESLSELRKDNDERSYSELLSAIVDLEINWVEINEAGQRNLLNQLESPASTILSAECIHQIIFNFGKLGVNLKRAGYKKIVVELVGKTLKEIEKDNGKGKLEVFRVVSLITN